MGAGVSVAFSGDPAAAAHSALRQHGRGSGGLAEDFNPRHTFDQFVIGDGNRLAHGAALAVAEAPGQAYNPLFLHAPPGLGKTHLLNAIANYITTFEPATTVRYTTVEAFTNGFIAALNGKALERFKHLYRDVDVLLIDDVQFLASKAKTEEEFFHTFNALYDSGRQLVLTCDRLPSRLTGIEQRLRERFESGLVAHLTPPDLSTRLTILRKRAMLDNIAIEDEAVLRLIAERVTDNVRSLEGALIRIVAQHSLTGRPIDAELGGCGTRPDSPRCQRSRPRQRPIDDRPASRSLSPTTSSLHRAIYPVPAASPISCGPGSWPSISHASSPTPRSSVLARPSEGATTQPFYTPAGVSLTASPSTMATQQIYNTSSRSSAVNSHDRSC